MGTLKPKPKSGNQSPYLGTKILHYLPPSKIYLYFKRTNSEIQKKKDNTNVGLLHRRESYQLNLNSIHAMEGNTLCMHIE